MRVALDQPPIRRIAARTETVDGFGWRAFTPAALEHPVTVSGGTQGEPLLLSNGLVAVAVDPADGTFSLDGLGGFGRLVDGGDLGDSYNFSPPRSDSLVEAPESVTVAVAERGPVRASAVVTATYRWPDHVDGGSQARVGEHTVAVTTTIQLRATEAVVRVTTDFVNPARDHRLRVHLPLPRPAEGSVAECAFAPVERGLTAEGCPNEFGLPTFPARRFVTAGGLTVVHDGVFEYELVDIDEGKAHTLAVTLLRSTGMLSRVGMAYRPFPAGPLTPVDGLQLAGKRLTAHYALATGDVDPYALADDVLVPLEVVPSLGGGDRPGEGSALEVTGAEVSAVHRNAGHLRSASTTRRRTRPPSRCGAGTAGGSTCAVRRSSGSTSASRYDPSGSPPSGSPTERSATGPAAGVTATGPRPPPVKRRSPTSRSSSRSRSTSPRRSHRALRRRSSSRVDPSPAVLARRHRHSWTRPRSFSTRGRIGWPTNSSPASATRRLRKSSAITTAPGLAMLTIRWARLTGGPK